MGIQLHNKKLLYEDQDFKVECEPFHPSLFLHVEVNTWKPSVLKRGYKVFSEIGRIAKERGYLRMVTITPNPKFVKLFGGVHVKSLEADGKQYEVMKWELK